VGTSRALGPFRFRQRLLIGSSFGGLGKPMTRKDYEKILRDAGWSAADIRFSMELASLHGEAEFDAFVKENCELMRRAEKSGRWKVLRQIRANRGRDA
jgi:hypothetical protein